MSKKKTTSCHHCHDPVSTHPDHRDQLTRVNRIAGQVEGIKRMIEEQRYCPDILVQTRAIRSALLALEGKLLDRHLDHCVAEAFTSGSASEREKKIAELQSLYRRFSD